MLNSKDDGGRDYSQYDAMSTQQLQQLLREDASRPEEASDAGAILYIMEVLAQRRRELHDGKSPEEALGSFKWQYDTQHFFDSEVRAVDPARRSRQLWKRGLVAVLAVAILLVGGTITAKALGFDLWKTITDWGDDVFYFSDMKKREDEKFSQNMDSTTYADLEDALASAGMEEMDAPTWLPKRFKKEDIRVYTYLLHKAVASRFSYEDGYIHIFLEVYDPASRGCAEKDSRPVEIYTSNGVDYYLFWNGRTLQAAWLVDSYQGMISGTVSKSEMKDIIDSIGKE